MNSRPFHAALALACGLAVAGILAPPPPAARAAGDPPLERWRSLMEKSHVPGLAVAVVRDTGIVAVATLGLRDVERGLPVTPRTRFYIASITKALLATATWSLAFEGTLDLAAPIRTYYPAFRLSDPGLTDSLALRDLLAHRPGLQSRAIGFATAFTGQMTDTTFDRLLGRARIRRSVTYNNLHYQIVGRVLAERLGRPWQEVLAERVFRPMGLERTSAKASVLYADADAAFPYSFRDGRAVPATRKTDRTMHAAGGVGSTLEDMARWMRLNLGEGTLDGRRVFPADLVRGMREMAAPSRDTHPLRAEWVRTGWSAGWELRELAGDPMCAHTGNYAGTAAHVSFMPGRNLGVVVLANGESPPLTEQVALEAYEWALGRATPDDGKFEKLVARFAASSPADSAYGRLTAPVRAYAGSFAHPDWGVVEIAAKRGGLDARIGDWPMPLVPAGDDRFVADDGTPGAFEIDRAGRVTAVWMRMDRADSVRFARR